jgi:hypothetical protein
MLRRCLLSNRSLRLSCLIALACFEILPHALSESCERRFPYVSLADVRIIGMQRPTLDKIAKLPQGPKGFIRRNYYVLRSNERHLITQFVSFASLKRFCCSLRSRFLRYGACPSSDPELVAGKG